jgi:hypothetical protein
MLLLKNISIDKGSHKAPAEISVLSGGAAAILQPLKRDAEKFMIRSSGARHEPDTLER